MILGELHLQLPLRRPGPVGKNIQDQTAAVDDPAGKRLLQRPALGGRKLVVNDGQVDLVRGDELLQLRRLAFADEGVGIGGVLVLHGGHDGLAAGGLYQLGQLRHSDLVGVFKIRSAVAGQAHQKAPAAYIFPLFQHTHGKRLLSWVIS